MPDHAPMLGEPLVSRAEPATALRADEALLETLSPDGPPRVRWYVTAGSALVLGFAQRTQGLALVDTSRCAARGVEVLERRAGGGLVLLDDGVLCLTVALPPAHPLSTNDLTDSYRWLGDALSSGLRSLGVREARRLEVEQARAEAAALATRGEHDTVAGLVRATCFGGVSPHEVMVGGAKLAGLAQVRRRQGALFQVGILLRDQSALADLVQVASDDQREALRRELALRTVGLDRLMQGVPEPDALASQLGVILSEAKNLG